MDGGLGTRQLRVRGWCLVECMQTAGRRIQAMIGGNSKVGCDWKVVLGQRGYVDRGRGPSSK